VNDNSIASISSTLLSHLPNLCI